MSSIQTFLDNELHLFKTVSSTSQKHTRPSSFLKRTPHADPRPDPRSFLFSSGSPSNVSSGLHRDSTVLVKDPLADISDYNDKFQIHRAIASTTNKENKIKVIDLIIQRREELQEARRKKKPSNVSTEGTTPVHMNHETHVLQHPKNTNKFKQSLQELVGQESSTRDSIPAKAFLTEVINGSQASNTLQQYQILDNKESEDSEPREEASKLVFPLERNSSIHKEISPAHKRLYTHSTPKSLLSIPGFRFGSQGGFSDSLLIKKSASQSSLSVQKNKQVSRQEEISTCSNEQGIQEGGLPVSLHPVKAASVQIGRSLPRIKSGSNELDPEIFSLGAKKLEKDIFKYLMKNEGREEGTRLILGLNQQKKDKIRNIEAKAIMQYKQTRREKSEKSGQYSSSSKDNVLGEQQMLRSKSTSGLRKGVEGSESVNGNPHRKLVRQGTRTKSSSFIRKVDMSRMFSVETPSEEMMKGNKISLDDSLYSYTETRLDCLYKQAGKTSKAIKQIENRMIVAQDSEESRSLSKIREIKIKDFNDHSRKIKVLIKKKVLNAFA